MEAQVKSNKLQQNVLKQKLYNLANDLANGFE